MNFLQIRCSKPKIDVGLSNGSNGLHQEEKKQKKASFQAYQFQRLDLHIK